MATSAVDLSSGMELIFGLNPGNPETLLVSIAQALQQKTANGVVADVASAIWTPQTEIVISNQAMSNPPSAVTLNGDTYCFYEAGQQLWCVSCTGGSSSPDIQMPANVSGTGIPSGVIYYGDIYLFYEGPGNSQLWYSIFNGTSWSSGTVPGVSMSGTPSAAVFTPAGASAPSLYVFYAGSGSNSGSLFYTVFNGSTWTNNSTAIAGVTGSPSALLFNCGLYVFHQGSAGNGQLWYSVFNGSTWAADKQVAGVAMSCSPSAVVFNYQLYVVYQGAAANGQVWYSVFNGSTWAMAAQASGLTMTASPSAFVYNNELMVALPWPGGTEISYSELLNAGAGGMAPTTGSASGPAVVVRNSVPYLFYLTAGQIWYNVYNGYNDWGPCTQLPNLEIAGSPGAVIFNSEAYIFYNGAGELWYSVLTFTENAWSWSSGVAPNITLSQSPSAAVCNGLLYVFYQGTTGNQLCYTTFNGTSWSAGAQVAGTTLVNSPAAAVFNNDLYVFHAASTGTGLNYNVFNGSTWAGDIAVSGAGISGSPGAVVAFNTQAGANQLGVVYKASGSSGAICYAVFSGSAWLTVQSFIPNVVTSASPSAVVFDSVLYVFYTGSGGSADELLYTILTNGAWSQPAAVANIGMGGTASAVVTTPAGYLEPQMFIFHGDATQDGALWYTQCNGAVWNNSQITSQLLSSGPSATVLNDDIYVFYQGSANALSYNLMTAPNQWTSGAVAGITISQSPTAVTFTPPGASASLLYVFYQDSGGDGLLWYITCNGITWSAAQQLVPAGGSATTAIMSQSPGAAVFTPSGATTAQLYVFYQGVGNNGQLWFSVSPDGISWTASQLAGASISNSPSTLVANSTLNIIYEGSGSSSGNLFYNSSANGTAWTPATQIGSLLTANSPALLPFDNLLFCLTQGFGGSSTAGTGNIGNGELWYDMFNGNNWSWNTMVNGVSISGTPCAVAYTSDTSPQPYVFYQSGTTAGQLWYTTYSGSGWSTPKQVTPVGSTTAITTAIMSQSPSAALYFQGLYVFYQGPGNNGTLWWSGPNSTGAISGFNCGQVIPTGGSASTAIMSQSPSAVVYTASATLGAGLYVFYQGPGGNGKLFYSLSYQGWEDWSAYQVTGITGYSPNTSPSAVVFNDAIYVFYSVGGSSSVNSGSLAYSVYNGTSWSAGIQPKLACPIEGLSCNMYQSPAAAVFNNQIFVFFQNPQATGALWYAVFNGSSWSAIMQAGNVNQMSGPTGNALPEAATSTASVFMNYAITPFGITV